MGLLPRLHQTRHFLPHRALQVRSLSSVSALAHHKRLAAWVDDRTRLLKPDRVVVVDGGDKEHSQILSDLLSQGVIERVPKRENSYYARTDPADVARAEQSTFICSKSKDDAGPNNNWVEPSSMRATMNKKFDGAMKGRTMFVIPFSMGPIGSLLSRVGIQVTDSAFVVANMNIMARVGKPVLDTLGKDGEFVACTHSVGKPLNPGEKGPIWPCNIPDRAIVHYPETREIESFGSGYGGNSLLGKKCLALRIASVMGRDEGWLAEHMLILGLTSPQGKKHYIAAAFPSACGKTNLAMMLPTLPGWKVNVVGDDIAWMRFGPDGRLRAINPEYGFFGVAPGTSNKTNPNAMASVAKNTIFTNVATTSDGDVWWEGMPAPASNVEITDWHGKKWDLKTAKHPAAHPNSRFTAPLAQCPALDPHWESPEGVPISAIVFGGRRPTTVPLVFQARSWAHGVFVGASVASEKTAAAEGGLGELRFDPFAQLPFCGYHFGDYFKHWLSMESKTTADKLPKIFHVNWFRQEHGKFLWPGFGENSRVLKWIVDRVDGTVGAESSAIGHLPRLVDLDLTGGIRNSVSDDALRQITSIEPARYVVEMDRIEAYHKQFEPRLPKELKDELQKTRNMLQGNR